MADFLTAFDQDNKVSQIPLPKPKFEIGYTKAKDELFSLCHKDVADHLNRQIRISFRFEKKNKLCLFSIKKLEHYGISTRIDFLLPTTVTFLRAIRMCSAFTPGCGYDNRTIILIGDVYCPNTKYLGEVCLLKKTFQSLGRSDYQCPQCASVCQVRNILFDDQTNSFLLSLGREVYIFEESPRSIQVVNGDVYCPGKYFSSKEKCESLGGYVTTPRPICASGKCGAWLFVHKVPFMLQQQVRTTKTNKTRFFSAKERWTSYRTSNCYSMFHFKQLIIERKKCVWTLKYTRLLETCIVQHVEMKSVFKFQIIKRLVSTTVRNAKPAATF